MLSQSGLGAVRGHAEITVLGVNRTGETLVRLRGEIRSGDGKTFLAIAEALTKAVILLDSLTHRRGAHKSES